MMMRQNLHFPIVSCSGQNSEVGSISITIILRAVEFSISCYRIYNNINGTERKQHRFIPTKLLRNKLCIIYNILCTMTNFLKFRSYI